MMEPTLSVSMRFIFKSQLTALDQVLPLVIAHKKKPLSGLFLFRGSTSLHENISHSLACCYFLQMLPDFVHGMPIFPEALGAAVFAFENDLRPAQTLTTPQHDQPSFVLRQYIKQEPMDTKALFPVALYLLFTHGHFLSDFFTPCYLSCYLVGYATTSMTFSHATAHLDIFQLLPQHPQPFLFFNHLRGMTQGTPHRLFHLFSVQSPKHLLIAHDIQRQLITIQLFTFFSGFLLDPLNATPVFFVKGSTAAGLFAFFLLCQP